MPRRRSAGPLPHLGERTGGVAEWRNGDRPHNGDVRRWGGNRADPAVDAAAQTRSSRSPVRPGRRPGHGGHAGSGSAEAGYVTALLPPLRVLVGVTDAEHWRYRGRNWDVRCYDQLHVHDPGRRPVWQRDHSHRRDPGLHVHSGNQRGYGNDDVADHPWCGRVSARSSWLAVQQCRAGRPVRRSSSAQRRGYHFVTVRT